jgi:hypothetical protein
MAAMAAVMFLGVRLAAAQTSAAAPGSVHSGVDSQPAAVASNTPAPTFTPSGPTNSLAQSPAPAPTCSSNYTITQLASGTVVSGTAMLAGSLCDDCDFPVALPFAYTLYDQTFTAARLSSNGQLDFGLPADHSFSNSCLPDLNTNYAILAYWRDLSMDNTSGGLQQCIDIGCGVYTSVSNASPNRIFNIEFRAISLHTFNPVYFEIRLYENQTKFDIVYTRLDSDSPNATIGVQKDTGSVVAQYQCPGSAGTLTNGTMLTFNLVTLCPTSTPTNTPTSTPSAGSLLVGHVTWQGRPAQPNPANILPITMTMRYQNGSTTNYTGLTTDASGFFTVPVGSLPNGTYTWRVKTAQVGASQSDYNPGFLSTSGQLVLGGGPVTNVDMGLQLSGDSNNDDRVTAVDFIAVKLSFGQQPGQPNWDRRADFDGNDRITAVDFVQLKINFGHNGSPPIGPDFVCGTCH